MALSANVQLDRRQVAARIVRGGAREVGRRGDRLGTQMEVAIAAMIDRDLRKGDGRDRPGIVSMRAINWQHEVDNPGRFPIDVTLFSPDLASKPMAGKFGALNYGISREYTQERAGGFSFVTTKGAKGGAGRRIVVGKVTQKPRGGHQWLDRVARLVVRRVI